MKQKVNQEQRAFFAWTILTNYAKKNESITYGELARQLKIHHRAVRYVLLIIQDFCMTNGLPPLTILILNKISRLPGAGFIAYDIENAQDGIDKVYSFDWRTVDNPFQYAQIGATENQLIKELIDSPDNSSEVFAKVKVRGISQRLFRLALLEVYGCSCAICGLSLEKALEASHIIPYSQSNTDQRLDVRNGLLLCSMHHKLFDNGLVVINQDYTIDYFDCKGDLLTYSNYDRLMTIRLNGQKLTLPKLKKHYPNKLYLNQHKSDNRK